MYPTPPTTHSARSRRQENSSGEESSGSNESRIDSHDRLRMGGPGRLPNWPIAMVPAQQLSGQLQNDLMSLAQQQIERYDLNYERVIVCQRYSIGHTPTAADNTLYIRFYEPSEHWVPAINSLITSAEQMGFGGRIEFVDLRAAAGPQSFAPVLSDDLIRAWPELEERVIRRLSANSIDWHLITLANRGYAENTAILTLVIKASIQFAPLIASMNSKIAGDIDG